MLPISTAYAAFAGIERIRRDACFIAFVYVNPDGSARDISGQQFELSFHDDSGATILTKKAPDITFPMTNRILVQLTAQDKTTLSRSQYSFVLFNSTASRSDVTGPFAWQKGRPSAQGVFTPADIKVIYNEVTNAVTVGGLVITGIAGARGWTPVLANVTSGNLVVQQVIDWAGGEGVKPATGQYIGSAGLVSNIAQATNIRGLKGDKGDRGFKAWSPIFAAVTDGERRVLQVVDWTGGEDAKPTVNLYMGAAGYVASIANAVDIRGSQGLAAWTPVLSLTQDGLRWVLRVSDWTGGEGQKPATNVYLGANGFVSAIGDAIDIRGRQGTTWSSAAAIPAAGTGVDGDFHMHRTSGDIYFKSNNTWAVIGNMRGPAGTLISSGLPEANTFLSTDKVVFQGADTALKKVPREVFLNLLTTGYPDVRPSLLLDFANSKQISPQIVCARLGVMSYFDPQGVMRQAPANVPAIDYDQLTGRCLGLSVWESRTNHFVNSTLQGATVGVLGAGGSLPTGWAMSRGTLTGNVSVDEIYTDSRGRPCIRISGNLTNNGGSEQYPRFRPGGSPVSSPGQIWTGSITFKSLTSNQSTRLFMEEGGGTPYAAQIIALPNTATELQTSVTRTFTTSNASGAVFQFGLNLPVGQNWTFTYDICAAQLEQGAVPSPLIPTAGVALTRANSVITVPTGNWFRASEGTLIVEAISPAYGRSNGDMCVVSLQSGSNTGNIRIARNTNRNYRSQLGGTNIVGGNWPDNTVKRIAVAYSETGISLVADGVVIGSAAGAIPNITQLAIGSFEADGSAYWNSCIRRIAYYPQRLPDSQLILSTSL